MTPLVIPRAVLRQARGVADEFTGHTGVPVDTAEIITGRAAMLGLTSPGRISAGGATRLLPGPDGWCALTLSRPDDIAAIPALLYADTAVDDPWPAVTAWVAEHTAAELVDRARLLGLPAAIVGETPAAPAVIRRTAPPCTQPVDGLLVVDLSSMWAGPLCGQLLARTGAVVVKVENPARPDGTRAGAAPFFNWMNSGKLSYATDFDDPEFAALLAAADVVIEASRPAALARRGLGPDSTPRDGRVWVRITGHGTGNADRVAFGDDAAASGGLVEYRDGAPVFIGDAIADPLTGLHAARDVVASLARGGGDLIELSMAAVAAGYAGLPTGGGVRAVAPAPASEASALGADQAAVRRLVRRRTAC